MALETDVARGRGLEAGMLKVRASVGIMAALVALVAAGCGGAETPSVEASGKAAVPVQAGGSVMPAEHADAGPALVGQEAQAASASAAAQPVEVSGAQGTGAAATRPPIYLDVRTPEEYAAGHVAGTLHIPLQELEHRWAELAQYRDQPLVVYCRTGRRSAAAIDLLATKGFSRLENGGGVTQMARRGLPMEPADCC
jgi:phage shock protein E